MRIIREGENLDRERVFACGVCGCVFEANSREYNMHIHVKCKRSYTCSCPNCGYTAGEAPEFEEENDV